jgi:hypothetical protein
LNIKPVMLPFFTPFELDVDKHTLKPYMASVNHNGINETTWLNINIVHTFMGIFCCKNDSKNNTTLMEDMGNNPLQQCKCIYSKCAIFSKMENIVSNVA